MSPLLVFAIALLATALLGFPTRALLARIGLLDRPNERSSHVRPTIRGGGVSFVVTIVLGLLALAVSARSVLWLALAAAALLLASMSFVDDRRGLGVGPRLAVHALVACVPTAAFLASGALTPLHLALAALAFVGTVVFTNALNFMDGIDGIATTHTLVAASATALLLGDAGASPPLVTAAALVGGAAGGFLPWNFPRARMFMGDVGSATLGFVLASLVVLGVRERGLALLPMLALPHTGFVLDVGITFLRRAARGERVWQAHREHFYQRWIRSGASHPQVTAAYSVATLASSLVALGSLHAAPRLVAAGVIAVVLGWLSLFALVERRFRRAPGARS